MRAKLLLLLIVFTLCGTPEATAGPNSVIVHLEPHGNAEGIVRFLHGRVLDRVPNKNVFLLDIPAIEPLRAHARALGVRVFEPNIKVKLNSATEGVIINAGGLLPQWYDAQPSLSLLGRQSAQLVSRGRSIVVADINSAVDYGHPALAGSLTSGYDFILSRPYDPSTGSLNQSSTGFLDQSSTGFLDGSISSLDTTTGNFLAASGVTTIAASTLGPQVMQSAYSHGTLCAGIIRAVAPESMIMPLRAFNDQGETDLFTIAQAINYAVAHGAQVINMSFGLSTDSETVRTSIQSAQAAGITLVASVGNANSEVPQFPAAYTGVIAVGATDITDLKGVFSNYGPYVDVSAPGVNMISPFPGGYFAVVSGTSFSAPIVAGEAALLRSVQTATDPTTAIKQKTVSIDTRNPGYVGLLGTGRVNLSQALGGN